MNGIAAVILIIGHSNSAELQIRSAPCHLCVSHILTRNVAMPSRTANGITTSAAANFEKGQEETSRIVFHNNTGPRESCVAGFHRVRCGLALCFYTERNLAVVYISST